MKKILIILGIFIMCLFLIFILSTSFVKRSAYFEQEYFKKTVARLDTLRSATQTVYDSVQAGFAKVSITPALNSSEDNYLEGKFIQLPLAGFGDRKGRPATGVHDSIFVKAAALKINGQTLVLVSADLLIMPPNITDSVAKLLSESGIRRKQLVFSATHTHSSPGGWGPGFIGKQFAGEENKNLEKWLVFQISRAVTSAIGDLKPARIGSGCFNAESFTRNRVIGESGTKNNDFCFICLEQIGHRKAIIGSFSAHATTLGEENMEVSADYPGYWSRRIESTAADVALFFAGSVGSQSPVGKGNGFERAKYIGEALADSVIVHIQDAPLSDKITFSYVPLKMQLPEYHIRLTTKINLSPGLSSKLMPPPADVYLQAIRIGNMVLITTPADFSGEYALQMKNALASKGFISNISSFNGSYVGYIVPGRYFYLNEYEPRLMGWFGPDMGEYTMDLIRQISEIVTGTDNL
jgi:neutral ceramidase